MTTQDKDYKSHWGYNLKEIYAMPRSQFASQFGQRFLNMSYCEFRRTIRKETPLYIPSEPRHGREAFKEDYKVSREDYRATQLGGWDDISVLI